MIFIGCGRLKRKGRCKARDLYTGVYFRTCLAFARSLEEDDRIFVLSAKYGVVALDQMVESYDLKLSDLSREELLKWKRRVLQFVRREAEKGFSIEFVCGRVYSDGLPGKNLLPKVGIGKQMRFMRQQMKPRGLLDVPRDSTF